MAGDAAPAGSEPLTVAQVTALIQGAIRRGVPQRVLVKGQVSNYKAHGSSGHSYFTLKDQTLACIDCVMYRSDAARLKFTPQDGMELLASGRIDIYAARSRYQLYVSSLQPLGQGALEIAFQQMRAKLERAGLFAAARKRTIPTYPARIALLTSKETAALADMLKVLRRYRWLKLWVYHVPVQGDGAGERIAEAIGHLCQTCRRIGGVDVIILGRGGGSLEDLWAFNEECVARAICASTIPIVTGIGHEVDVSIADLVADYHAHTPTEAAQVVVSGWRTARDAVEILDVRLRRELRDAVQQRRQWLSGIERHEAFRRPLDRVGQCRQQLDDRQRWLMAAIETRLHAARRRVQELGLRLEHNRPSVHLLRRRQELATRQRRLNNAAATRLRRWDQRLRRVVIRLAALHPRHAVGLERMRLGATHVRLRCAVDNQMDRRQAMVAGLATHLNAIGPQQVLQRGYSITSLKKGALVVRRSGQVKPGDRLVTRLADGQVESTADDPHQPGLFE